jgi:hypothetical protein
MTTPNAIEHQTITFIRADVNGKKHKLCKRLGELTAEEGRLVVEQLEARIQRDAEHVRRVRKFLDKRLGIEG